MKIHVEETTGIRRASASIRQAGVIDVKIPRHWPKALKQSVVTELVEKIQRKDTRETRLLDKAATQPHITLTSQADLQRFVMHINAETLNVPLGKVQIGYARYNHLAQVNLRTKTMTVSRYCLNNAPVEALRYLIIHELAHYFEAGHGPNFWAHVERHVPDYKLQSRIIKAFHHQSVIHEAAAIEAGQENDAIASLTEAFPGESLPSLFPTEIPPTTTRRTARPTPGRGKSYGTLDRHAEPALSASTKMPAPSNNKTGQWLPGLVKQLQFWLDA